MPGGGGEDPMERKELLLVVFLEAEKAAVKRMKGARMKRRRR